MDLQQFQQLLLQRQKEIEQAMRRTLLVKVGRIAKDHFQTGFRQGGFQDNGTQAWQRKKRPDKYGPLMSSRQNLYGSIYYRPDDYSVDYTPEQQVAYETMVLNNYEVDGSYFEEKYNIPAGERRQMLTPVAPTEQPQDDEDTNGNKTPKKDKKTRQEQNNVRPFFD
ncbi:MAG: hypothetical protein IJ140_05130 [Prevotella sp.]|nr:hypothetical protein [Prevotella sp.]